MLFFNHRNGHTAHRIPTQKGGLTAWAVHTPPTHSARLPLLMAFNTLYPTQSIKST